MPDNNLQNGNISAPDTGDMSKANPMDTAIDNFRKPIEEKAGIPSDEAIASEATEAITGKPTDEAAPEVEKGKEQAREAGHEAVNQTADVAAKAAVKVGRGVLAAYTGGASEAVLATPVGKYAEKKLEGVASNTIKQVGNQVVDEATASEDGKNGKLEGDDNLQEETGASQEQIEKQRKQMQAQKQKKEFSLASSLTPKLEFGGDFKKKAMMLGLALLPVLLIIIPFLLIMSPSGGGYVETVDPEEKTGIVGSTTTQPWSPGGGTNNPSDGQNEGSNDPNQNNLIDGEYGVEGDGLVNGVVCGNTNGVVSGSKDLPEGKVVTGGVIPDNGSLGIPYFNQCDSRWGDLPYGGQDICNAGCGMTSISMVVSYFLGGEDSSKWQFPNDVRQKIADKNNGNYNAYHCFDDNGNPCGAYHYLVERVADHYGISHSTVPRDLEVIRETLRSGKPIIAVMSGRAGKYRTFTSQGHFIVLSGVDEEGNILVNDPNHSGYANYAFCGELIMHEISEIGASLYAFWK